MDLFRNSKLICIFILFTTNIYAANLIRFVNKSNHTIHIRLTRHNCVNFVGNAAESFDIPARSSSIKSFSFDNNCTVGTENFVGVVYTYLNKFPLPDNTVINGRLIISAVAHTGSEKSTTTTQNYILAKPLNTWVLIKRSGSMLFEIDYTDLLADKASESPLLKSHFNELTEAINDVIDENNKQADQCQNKPITTTINFTATIPDLK